MKKIFAFSMACLTLAGCSKDKGMKYPRVVVSTIPDVTDKHILQPSAEVLYALYGFETNPGIEATFRLVLITDTKMTPPIEFYLANEGVTKKRKGGDNPKNRQQHIAKFKDAIAGAIDQYHGLYDKDTLMLHSYAYKTIVDEICYISKLKCDRSYLAVYSNLFENSNLISVYSPTGKVMLKDAPMKIVAIFTKACPLPKNLKGLTVIFIYTTRNNEQADMYLQMVNEVYRKILEPRGVQVILQATDAPINPMLYEPQQQP